MSGTHQEFYLSRCIITRAQFSNHQTSKLASTRLSFPAFMKNISYRASGEGASEEKLDILGVDCFENPPKTQNKRKTIFVMKNSSHDRQCVTQRLTNSHAKRRFNTSEMVILIVRQGRERKQRWVLKRNTPNNAPNMANEETSTYVMKTCRIVSTAERACSQTTIFGRSSSKHDISREHRRCGRGNSANCFYQINQKHIQNTPNFVERLMRNVNT